MLSRTFFTSFQTISEPMPTVKISINKQRPILYQSLPGVVSTLTDPKSLGQKQPVVLKLTLPENPKYSWSGFGKRTHCLAGRRRNCLLDRRGIRFGETMPFPAVSYTHLTLPTKRI